MNSTTDSEVDSNDLGIVNRKTGVLKYMRTHTDTKTVNDDKYDRSFGAYARSDASGRYEKINTQEFHRMKKMDVMQHTTKTIQTKSDLC